MIEIWDIFNVSFRPMSIFVWVDTYNFFLIALRTILMHNL